MDSRNTVHAMASRFVVMNDGKIFSISGSGSRVDRRTAACIFDGRDLNGKLAAENRCRSLPGWRCRRESRTARG